MTKSFKEMQGIKEACWVGYKQVGMKKKGDRMVPNCVKEEVVDAVFGKDYVYQENYQDMYKGKLNKDQIATIKNTWAGKKASDVTQGVRDMVKNMDQFTRMDIKKANIKHISALINDEYDFALPLSDLIEMQEFNAAVRHTELKEFTDEQISKLAKSYADLAGKTMSVQNANKLRKLFDRIPDSSLNKLRKKKIPFLSGLALSRMIQKKIPVNESAYNDESAWEVSGVENEGREELQEAKYTIEYEVESDSNADDRYVGEDEMTVNASSPKEAAKKFGQEMNKLVKKAGRTSRSVLKVYMNDMDKDGVSLSDRELDKLNDHANDIIYKNIRNSYEEGMPGGANTSTKQGSASKSAKKKYRFGYRVADTTTKEKSLEEQAKELEEQLKTAEKELEELYIKEDKAYVIRFKRIKDKERMVVVFRNQNDADMYADNIKKQGGQVFSNKLEKIPYKVVDKK